MPDLLLELLSEEIPARMQARAADDLRKLVTDGLVEAGLTYEGAKAFVTPRRLALWVAGVPATSPDIAEERKGPRVGAPEAAVQGFLKAAGLESLEQAEIRTDPKKGDFHVAMIRRPGRPAADILAELIPDVIRAFPWPKSMRWGARSAEPSALRWVRPLRSIVCLFGPETEEPEIVRFEVDGIASGDTTSGHRFLAPEPFAVRRLSDYAEKLEKARVVLDPERRRNAILADAKDLALAQGLELVEDEALLAEVAGLVEWPVVLMGSFDEAFLAVPDEAVRTTIRANQKCFVLRDPVTGKLANRFILVANTEARDGGAAIVAGNERVIRARLSDARFFWEQDLKVPLDTRREKLKEITFHEKLGTQWERVERIKHLAREIAPLVGAEPAKAERAAELAKADLVTEMVGEFPELQGLMGRYYAAAQGEEASVAAAIEEHYRPQGPSDRVPADPVSVVVALADKLDTLVGFWTINEKPTGSKDPFALRRAALGVVRLVLESSFRISMRKVIGQQWVHWSSTRMQNATMRSIPVLQVALKQGFDLSTFQEEKSIISALVKQNNPLDSNLLEEDLNRHYDEIIPGLLAFFADRLKVHLREQGARHDLIDAVFALGNQDDLLLIVRRVEALGRFLETEDGRNLLAGVKRASNILRIEEKKDSRAFDGAPDAALLQVEEERALAHAIAEVKPEAEAAVAREDFSAAMTALARLRSAVDAFFEKVTVNADDSALRENRLRLLNEIRAATQSVADFSKIEG